MMYSSNTRLAALGTHGPRVLYMLELAQTWEQVEQWLARSISLSRVLVLDGMIEHY